ncbi:MAG: Type II secretion system protein L [uncultured Thiotrichaceae bacterium]|uniref:Type II secretion system protein L n=1 Tax=uncultured Thiotrichaceae bacterium TaxID=298394 RepID=A0A6S6SNB7_9GAMM|nr:MAG: Type II secretion system protein L [uncultured Thiotrichaceae bacterium]
MQWLVIRATAPTADVAEYAILEKNQQHATFSRVAWDQLVAYAKNRRCVLLIPTEDVLLKTLELPTQNAKQLTKMIPYAIEESIADDLDSVHITHFLEKTSGKTFTTAIKKALLKTWQETLKKAGITAHCILPDVFALPVNGLLINQSNSILRPHKFEGYAAPVNFTEQLVNEYIIKRLAEPASLMVNQGDLKAFEIPEDLSTSFEPEMNTRCHTDLLDALPLNLLQNFHSGGTSSLMEGLRPWRVAAGLALACGILWTGMNMYKNHQLKQQVAQLDAAIVEVFKSTFPKTRVDSDYRILHATMAEKLKALNLGASTNTSSALEVLASFAPTLKKQKNINIKSLNYSNQAFDLAISAPSLSVLEKFRASLDQGKIDAQIKSSSSSSNKVDAVMVIKSEVTQ